MTALIIIGWIACTIAATGIFNAHCRAAFPMLFTIGLCSEREATREARNTLAVSVGLSLFGPIALVVVFFMTGFAQDGWTLSSKPIPREAR